jgi:hypothetical protein
MAVTVPDQETLKAIKGFWDSDQDLKSTFGPLRGGRLKSPDGLPTPDNTNQGQQSLPTAVERKPYAKQSVEQGPSQHQYYAPVQAGQGYIDYRKLTITGYGRRSEMLTLASLLRQKLAWMPRDGKTLQPFFTNSYLMVIRPLMEPHIVEDETVKDGKDVWNCIADFEIVTTRTIAAT